MTDKKSDNVDHFRNIAVLSDDKRKSIIKLLFENDHALSFKNISDMTEIKPTSLAYHIKILLDEDLVFKTYALEPGRRDYTRYDLTRIGKATFEFSETMDLLSTEELPVDAERLHASISLIPMELGPRVIRLGDMNDQ